MKSFFVASLLAAASSVLAAPAPIPAPTPVRSSSTPILSANLMTDH